MDAKSVRRRKRRRIVKNVIRISFLILIICLVINPIRSISTLKKVDEYPLYTMRWYGGYGYLKILGKFYNFMHKPTPPKIPPAKQPAGCSLFCAMGDPDRPVYGRNFDWAFSPALILFCQPKEGYKSVSVIDLAYLGFTEENAKDPPWYLKNRLVLAAGIPLEGINECGLTIASASVPNIDPLIDPEKENLLGVGAIRVILDKARTTEEAVNILKKYNIYFPVGTSIHFLIADMSGDSAVVEFLDKGMVVMRNQEPWQAATNYYLAPGKEAHNCFRYQRATEVLQKAQGKLTPAEAMELLKNIKMGCTQWSIVYDMKNLSLDVCLNTNYTKVYTFKLNGP